MTLKTIDREYRAVQKLHASPSIRAYVCICSNAPDEKTVLVTGIADRTLSEKFLPFYMDLHGRGIVGSFTDSFIRDGTVWAVSDYAAGTPFFETGKEALPTEEKIVLAGALAEQIFAQNLPVYLQYEALHPKNIVVGAARSLSVNFLLFTPELLGDDLFPGVQKRFSDCLAALFHEELKQEASEELADFIKKLTAASFSGEAALLGAFRQMSAALRNAQGEGKLLRNGLLLRLWNRMIQNTAAVPAVLYWMLVGALSGLLLFVCLIPEDAPAQRNQIQNIGILRITPLPPVENMGAGEKETESVPPQEAPSTENETLQSPLQDTQSTEENNPRPEMG